MNTEKELSAADSVAARAPYLAYRVGSAVARRLPGSVVFGLAQALAVLVARRPGKPGSRRDMIERHLRRAHGYPPDDQAMRRSVRAAYVSYARYWVESFRLPDQTPADLDAGLSYEGLGNLEEAVAEGKGVILCLPHLGGWDYGGAWLATHGYPMKVVVEPVEPPELFEWFAKLRNNLGLTVVPLGASSAMTILKTLRSGGIVALLSDRDLTRDGVEVTFFGEETTLPAGPITLALRTGAAVLPTTIYFTGGGGHHGVIRPPLVLDRSESLRDDIKRHSQTLADELEGLIRAAPEQWHLFQPNWPSDPGYRD